MAITKRSDKGSALTYNEMDDNFDAIAPRTSATGAIEIPAGATSDRPGSPASGMFRYNTSLNSFEGYSSGAWGAIAGGGASGGDVNQNAWSEFIVSGQSAVSADNATDSVTLIAGTNMSITTDAAADSITFNATFTQDFRYSSLTNTPTIPSELTDLGISDGTLGQVLSTDGNGNFTFVNQSGGGLQGVQGITGLQGPLGTTLQGVQGPIGPTGADGADGTDGQPGIQGPAGTAQGTQGIQGSDGFQGSTGSSIQGVQGPAAEMQGTQGPEGAPGDVGVQGFQGFQGPAGSVQGLQGLQGSNGFDGQPGFQGMQGPAGSVQGTQGVQGEVGPAGFGNQGVQGTQGLIGPGGTGPQGIQGLQGPQSIQGMQGAEGGDGPDGPQGIQGPAGSVQGIQGITGGSGPTGAQGIQGEAIQGADGNATQGVQGPLGFQGTAGSGAQGVTGDTGSQGVQGNTGLQGRNGFQGLTGAGTQGTQGVQGPGGFGPQGVQGPTAFQGLQGLQGPDNGIGLTTFSVTTGTPAGGGSLTYSDTNGEFTFTPADTSTVSSNFNLDQYKIYTDDQTPSLTIEYQASSAARAQIELGGGGTEGEIALNTYNANNALSSTLFMNNDRATIDVPFQVANLTTTERDNVPSPAAGMLIWNVSTAQLEVYNGSTWAAV